MRSAKALDQLRESLRPGQAYRRSDLARHSSNIDRHLVTLVREGRLKKLKQGMYSCPRSTVFGDAPPDEEALLRTFLKEDHFIVYSPNIFNSLGLGMTQLYNRRVVLNRKRHGEVTLGGRTYFFHRWREVPKTVTEEFLVVELLNRPGTLAEDRQQVLKLLKEKLPNLNQEKLQTASEKFGTYSTQLKLRELLGDPKVPHAT